MGRGGSGYSHDGRIVREYNGDELYLEHPLKYDDSLEDYSDYVNIFGRHLGATLQNHLDQFRNQHAASDVEWGMSLGIDGDILDYKKGDTGSVQMSRLGFLFTHIHPRQPGILGGSFSILDMKGFSSAWELREMRAVAKEGIYRIQKTERFNPEGFMRYITRQREKLQSASQERFDEIHDNYRNGYYDYNTYITSVNDSNNRYFVAMHDVYRRGAKKYGYRYALERR